MSWAILTDDSGRHPTSVLYCNTTDVAFGPVMYDTARHEVWEFVKSLPRDPRLMIDADLHDAWDAWQNVVEEAEV